MARRLLTEPGGRFEEEIRPRNDPHLALDSLGASVIKLTTGRIAFVFLTLSAPLMGVALGCEGPSAARLSEGADVETKAASFTIVVLPDTQYYAATYPEILEAQTKWIVQERDAAGIALVVHEGDIVDRDEPRQWERASRSLHVLDGVVPYVLSAGNHDYRKSGPIHQSRDAHRPLLPRAGHRAEAHASSGTFEPGRIENTLRDRRDGGRPLADLVPGVRAARRGPRLGRRRREALRRHCQPSW